MIASVVFFGSLKMAQSNSKKKDKNIGSRSTLDELATAIASLGNRTDELKDEIWGVKP